MFRQLKPLLISSVVLATGPSVHAQLALPGKTLKKPSISRTGIKQPAKNTKNILKAPPTAPCPHIGKSLRDLLLYARANRPALYRQAVKQRRTGFSQEQTRVWLLDAVCIAEGFAPPSAD